MPTERTFNLAGINTYVNPILKEAGQALTSVNMVSDPFGAKSKRNGYDTFLGTANGSAVTSLFSWTKDDGSLFVYRASGGLLYYSIAGTGPWTIAGNGTLGAGTSHVGHAVLNNTLILGDGIGSTRHTTSGTAFTNTTLAPVGQYFEEFQRRVFIGGTQSTASYSVSNDATNWALSGTSDSSSFEITGAGIINGVKKVADRLNFFKTSGIAKRWDGNSIVDLATESAPTSPYSLSMKEGYLFGLNRDGVVGYGGERFKMLSNAVQSQIYNNLGSAIAGTTFETAPATTHHYDYYLSTGTAIVDGLTRNTINNCVLKYDYLKNEFLDFSLANNPTAWHSFRDANKVQQLIFGDESGQCYKFVGTATTDNGSSIVCRLEYVIDMNAPEDDKLWRWIWIFTNPGCQAKCQIAFADTYRRDSKIWVEVGDLTAGVTELRIPTDRNGDPRSKLMFIKFYESSKDVPFTLYGFVVDAELESKK